MKQGAALTKIVMALLLIAILAYLAGAAWRGLREPYPTVRAYSYDLEDTVETTGYLARKEEIVTGSAGIVRLLPAEGEKVHVGAAVAVLYADRQSLERSERLGELEEEVAQLTAAIAAAGETNQGDSEELVVDALVKLRSAVEKGDFTRLEDQVSTFKSTVYLQAQRYGEAGDLAAALAAAQTEIAALRAQTAQSVGYVTVGKSGLFSGQADGYESVLAPDALEGLTPTDLDNLENHTLPVGSSVLGKLITDSTWYFVCPVSDETALRLTVGGRVTVRFSRDWSGEVDMTVERIGSSEGGRVPVILSSNRYLSEVTLLRRQTVDLVFDRRTGIRVPTAAIRVEERETTDPETGESAPVKVIGVYVKVGVKAEFKPVTILDQGKDYYIVEPLLPENPNQTAEKKALRPGDDVIVGGDNVWDGKVLQ